MPSPHPRVGLVLDEEMSEALVALREQLGEDLPQAGLARRAVLEGVAFQAIVHEARSASGHRETALQLLRDLRSLLENVRLPSAVRAGVLEELDRVSADDTKQERRRRQMALVHTPDPHGLTALGVSDTIDAFDRQPA